MAYETRMSEPITETPLALRIMTQVHILVAHQFIHAITPPSDDADRLLHDAMAKLRRTVGEVEGLTLDRDMLREELHRITNSR